MKTTSSLFHSVAAAIAGVIVFASTVSAAPSSVSTQLNPARITLGQSAQFTITISGGGDDPVSLPAVPGLEFVAVGQSSQIQSVNGVTSSTTSQTYEVIPQHAGTFKIPALNHGAQQLVLYVQPGNNSSPSALPAPAPTGVPGEEAQPPPEGTASVRMDLPKHELYVGETVPVDIQVVMRPGLVASLNGLPTLNGDAFMLSKLTSQPEQNEEVLDGKPYTVLTWHGALTAIQSGDFPLTVETPLTVRMRTKRQSLPQMPHFPGNLFDDSAFDDFFNDPFFQDFFGGSTEKEITVTSDSATLKVLPLPADGRPAGFSGAVGNFEVNGELSALKAGVGDPLTLRLKITGAGNFDRVNSTMLGQVDGWKTYPPTAKFEPSDNAGYSGEKDFEQAIIPMQPGSQTVPPLAFSFFNPETRRYETKLTAPLSVEVSPASAGGLTANSPAPNSSPGNETPPDGLRPDHVETGSTVAILRPLYFQPWFVGAQSALALSFTGALIFLRRRETRANDADGARQRESSSAIENCLAEMDAASTAGDAARFFQSARVAFQQKLAQRWRVAPASITIAEIDARLNGKGGEIRRVFALADQAAYSRERLSTADFQQWKETVRNQLQFSEAL